MMVCVLSVVNKVVGYDIGEEDDTEKARFIWNYIVHTFLNSVGGIEEPNVQFWGSNLPNEGKTRDEMAYFVPKAFEAMIWMSWVTTVVVLFIILCNFMISYISQTYEDVLEHQTEDTYSERCGLNSEYYTMLKFIRKYIMRTSQAEEAAYNFNCFLVTADFNNIDKD